MSLQAEAKLAHALQERLYDERVAMFVECG
jgi:hypothetical protein